MSNSQPPPPADYLAPGQRLKTLPGDAINAGVWARNQLAGDPLFKRRNRGGSSSGGGGGSSSTTAKPCILIDDLLGFTWTDNAATVTPVRVLDLAIAEGGFSYVKDGPLVSVLPQEGPAVTLADTGCCGGDSVSTPAGERTISGPHLAKTTAEAEAMTFTGTGGTQGSTVQLYAVASGTAASPASGSAISGATDTVAQDGSWSITADLSGYDGYVKVSAGETPLGESELPRRSILTVVDQNHVSSGAPGSAADTLPDLLTADDLGQSSTDNRTSDTSPRINCTLPAPGSGVLSLRLYYNGDLAATLNDPVAGGSPWDEGDVVEIEPSSSVGVGLGLWQFVLVGNDTNFPGPDQNLFSGASQPLYIYVDSEESTQPSSEGTDDGIRYGRTGLYVTVSGQKVLDRIGPCPIKLTPFVSDRANGYICATATLDNDLTGQATASVASVTLVNDTETADPDVSSLTVVDNPDALNGTNGDKAYLRLNGASWELREVEAAS